VLRALARAAQEEVEQTAILQTVMFLLIAEVVNA
jgi:hypothetical protein